MQRSHLLFLLLIPATASAQNWYEKSFWLLHEDHHTNGSAEVGRDADLEETSRLIHLISPDVIQIHAKGNPGWTTYPSQVGHTPPKLTRDVLAIWRDVALRQDCHFSAYFNIGRDAEIMNRRPEWNRMHFDGSPVDRALCYHSGVAEGYLWPMIGEIMTGYRPQGFWFDGSCFTVRQCYCNACRSRFQREHGLSPPRSAGEKGWADYHRMQRQVYREFIAETCRRIHDIDPACLVAFNWAYSLRMPEEPDPGIAYLTGDIGNGVEGLSVEAHWYDSTDHPFDLMTQINTLQPVNKEPSARLAMAPKPTCQLTQEMAIIVANGGRYNAWDTPTPESGLIPERFEFMANTVTPYLRSRQAWWQSTRRTPEVSLLHSAAIHYAITEPSATSFTKRNNRLEGAARRLPELHLNYEMLPDWRLAAGDVRAPLVIVEHAKGMTRPTADHLLEFTRNGGAVLLTGMSLTQDDRFPELLGTRVTQGATAAEPLSVRLEDGEHAFEHWLFKLAADSGRTLLEARTSSGEAYPLLVSREVGKGRLFCVPLPLLSNHGAQSVPEPVLEAIFEQILPASQRQLTTTAPKTVECVLRERGRQRIVHLVNMAAGDRDVYQAGERSYPVIHSLPPVSPCRIRVRLEQPPVFVTLQPQAEPLHNWTYQDGHLTCDLPEFAVHQIVVIE